MPIVDPDDPDAEIFGVVGVGVVGKMIVGYDGPTSEGIEYSLPESKPHYTLPVSRPHYTFRTEDMSKAPEIHSMDLDEEEIYSVNFSGKLDDGVSLTGVPTIADVTGLTLSSKVVNSDTLTINGESVAAGKAVQFFVDPQAVGIYEVDIACSTDATPTETKRGTITLIVNAN